MSARWHYVFICLSRFEVEHCELWQAVTVIHDIAKWKQILIKELEMEWIGMKWNEGKWNHDKVILLIAFCGYSVRQIKIVNMTISVNKISVKTIFVKTISVKITFLRANRNTTKIWMHVMVIGKNGMIRYSTVWYGIDWYGIRRMEKWNVKMEKLKRSCVRSGRRGCACVCECGVVMRGGEEEVKWEIN